MLTLSGCGVVVLLSFISDWTCVVVSVILIVCSLNVPLYMCMFVLCVYVLVNCLLNAFAICVGEINVFSLKVIVLFLGCVFLNRLIRVLSSKEYECVFVISLYV